MTKTTIRLDVNGQAYEVAARPDRFLVDLLRDDSASSASRKPVTKASAVPAPS